MMKVQFFLFGLILVWFTASGKLRALWTALQTTPQHADSSAPSAPPTTPTPPPIIVGPMPGPINPEPSPVLPIMPV